MAQGSEITILQRFRLLQKKNPVKDTSISFWHCHEGCASDVWLLHTRELLLLTAVPGPPQTCVWQSLNQVPLTPSQAHSEHCLQSSTAWDLNQTSPVEQIHSWDTTWLFLLLVNALCSIWLASEWCLISRQGFDCGFQEWQPSSNSLTCTVMVLISRWKNMNRFGFGLEKNIMSSKFCLLKVIFGRFNCYSEMKSQNCWGWKEP